MQDALSILVGVAALFGGAMAQKIANCPGRIIDCSNLRPATQYTVASGVFLNDISDCFGVPICTLGAANNIANVNMIKAGETFQIPKQICLTDDCPATCPDGQWSYHIITAGETFQSIANKLGGGVTTEQIVKLNPDRVPTQLQPGMGVKLPVCAGPF